MRCRSVCKLPGSFATASPPRRTMIELQGDLVKKTESWDNQKLGDLEVRGTRARPFLTIGSHERSVGNQGCVALKKPFVVLDPAKTRRLRGGG